MLKQSHGTGALDHSGKAPTGLPDNARQYTGRTDYFGERLQPSSEGGTMTVGTTQGVPQTSGSTQELQGHQDITLAPRTSTSNKVSAMEKLGLRVRGDYHGMAAFDSLSDRIGLPHRMDSKLNAKNWDAHKRARGMTDHHAELAKLGMELTAAQTVWGLEKLAAAVVSIKKTTIAKPRSSDAATALGIACPPPVKKKPMTEEAQAAAEMDQIDIARRKGEEVRDMPKMANYIKEAQGLQGSMGSMTPGGKGTMVTGPGGGGTGKMIPAGMKQPMGKTPSTTGVAAGAANAAAAATRRPVQQQAQQPQQNYLQPGTPQFNRAYQELRQQQDPRLSGQHPTGQGYQPTPPQPGTVREPHVRPGSVSAAERMSAGDLGGNLLTGGMHFGSLMGVGKEEGARRRAARGEASREGPGTAQEIYERVARGDTGNLTPFEANIIRFQRYSPTRFLADPISNVWSGHGWRGLNPFYKRSHEKTAAELAADHPQVAGFLAYCHEQGASGEVMLTCLEKAAEVNDTFGLAVREFIKESQPQAVPMGPAAGGAATTPRPTRVHTAPRPEVTWPWAQGAQGPATTGRQPAPATRQPAPMPKPTQPAQPTQPQPYVPPVQKYKYLKNVPQTPQGALLAPETEGGVSMRTRPLTAAESAFRRNTPLYTGGYTAKELRNKPGHKGRQLFEDYKQWQEAMKEHSRAVRAMGQAPKYGKDPLATKGMQEALTAAGLMKGGKVDPAFLKHWQQQRAVEGGTVGSHDWTMKDPKTGETHFFPDPTSADPTIIMRDFMGRQAATRAGKERLRKAQEAWANMNVLERGFNVLTQGPEATRSQMLQDPRNIVSKHMAGTEGQVLTPTGEYIDNPWLKDPRSKGTLIPDWNTFSRAATGIGGALPSGLADLAQGAGLIDPEKRMIPKGESAARDIISPFQRMFGMRGQQELVQDPETGEWSYGQTPRSQWARDLTTQKDYVKAKENLMGPDATPGQRALGKIMTFIPENVQDIQGTVAGSKLVSKVPGGAATQKAVAPLAIPAMAGTAIGQEALENLAPETAEQTRAYADALQKGIGVLTPTSTLAKMAPAVHGFTGAQQMLDEMPDARATAAALSGRSGEAQAAADESLAAYRQAGEAYKANPTPENQRAYAATVAKAMDNAVSTADRNAIHQEAMKTRMAPIGDNPPQDPMAQEDALARKQAAAARAAEVANNPNATDGEKLNAAGDSLAAAANAKGKKGAQEQAQRYADGQQTPEDQNEAVNNAADDLGADKNDEGMMSQVWDFVTNMDPGSQAMLALGIGIPVISMLAGGLSGGSMMNWLLGGLAVGGGLAAAATGFLGEGAQDFVGGLGQGAMDWMGVGDQKIFGGEGEGPGLADLAAIATGLRGEGSMAEQLGKDYSPEQIAKVIPMGKNMGYLTPEMEKQLDKAVTHKGGWGEYLSGKMGGPTVASEMAKAGIKDPKAQENLIQAWKIYRQQNPVKPAA